MRFHGAVRFVLSSHMRLEGFWQIFVVAVIAWCCDGLPTTMDRFKRSPVYDNVQNYLVQYGYLPHARNSLVADNLRTEDQLKDAIRSLQTFGNIPVTGELDVETMQLLSSPRCGLPDVLSADNVRRKRYALQGQQWAHKNLTWSLQPNDKMQNLDYYKVLEVLEKAFNLWSKHSKLTFKSVYSSNADILIYFDRQQHGDGFPFDGLGGVLAHAFFPGSGRGGDVHFDSDEIWELEETADNSKGTSLIGVAAHEFGHSLGLSHSSVSGSLMSPWYQGWKDNFQLPDDDRAAIQRIYGPNTDTSTTTKSPPTYRPPYTRYTSRYTPPQPPSTRPPQVPRTKPPNPESIPDKCDTSYDAITMIRGELFIFKDKYMWRISEKGLYNEFPNLIRRMWPQLPEDLTHVDAVYEKNDHKHIVFLIGRRIYMFHGTELLLGYPKPLVEWGFPATLDHIDAAMVWGYNSKTYFFSGYEYWRFDDEINKVDLDYPRNMSIWKGIGTNIDAAFQWKNGVTYFFKGKGYWKFNDIKLSVFNKHQSPSAQFWMGCPKSLQNLNDIESSSQESIISVYDLKPNGFFVSHQYTILIVSIIIAVILVITVVVIIGRRNSHSYIRPKRMNR